MSEALESDILSLDSFQTLLANASKRAILHDLPAVKSEESTGSIDWDFALLCCSALTSAITEAGQDAALRIAQACLTAEDSDIFHREAASLLLERMGNWPAVNLAEQRQLVQFDAWTFAPAPLLLDVVRRRLELTIPLASGKSIPVNRFQRRFWTAVETARWVSVSAPTSAGKSFIVKRWFEEALAGESTARAVYIVPTRALIEEVSADLREEFPSQVAIFTLPWDAAIGTAEKEIHVLTQERLHLLQQRFPDFAPDLVFVDEAQKFGDDSRGVLLQRVIDEEIRRNTDAQVLFASPLSQNPELLLEGAPDGTVASALYSEVVTVNQNLLWANQVPRKPTVWTLQRVAGGQETTIGQFDLPARPSPESKRLPLVAVALGKASPGNVVYVNGAAAAETTRCKPLMH